MSNCGPGTTACTAADSIEQDFPPEIRDRAERASGHVVVLATITSLRATPLKAACETFGLTGLQTRVAMATIRCGTIKQAAAQLGISYDTARQTLSEAMRRVGVDQLPGVVANLASLALGVLPGGYPTSGSRKRTVR